MKQRDLDFWKLSITIWGWAQGNVIAARYPKDRVNGKFDRNSKTNVTLWRVKASRIKSFTHREYARLQTFPDNWVFVGENKRDIHLQIGNAVPVHFAKHLARNIRNSLECLDQGSPFYDKEVRSFEAFKHLHIGMLAEIKRKSLPAIARVAGLEQEQSLHHFLTTSPWKVEQMREQRIKLILQVLEGQRIFSDGTTQQRYIREIIFGKRRATQFWEITTDPQTLPKNSTWHVMTHVPEIKYHQVGNLYGLRNWVEYGLKQSKNELGWADFRVTDYAQIQKWWEVVMSAYLLVSLHSASLNPRPNFPGDDKPSVVVKKFFRHPWWDEGAGWKNLLNNLRLVLQPFVLFNLIRPWLKVFPIPALSLGFSRLIALMNYFHGAVPMPLPRPDFLFSAA